MQEVVSMLSARPYSRQISTKFIKSESSDKRTNNTEKQTGYPEENNYNRMSGLGPDNRAVWTPNIRRQEAT